MAITTTLVRRATASDAPGICSLLDAVSAEDRWLITPPGHRTPAATAAALAQAPAWAATWVAVDAALRVVGLLECLQGSVPALVHTATFGMAVHASARRQGAGRALVDAAELWARGRGVQKMHIVCAGSNEPGLAFYAALGYVVEGRQRRQYRLAGQWTDAVWLARWLDPEEEHP